MYRKVQLALSFEQVCNKKIADFKLLIPCTLIQLLQPEKCTHNLHNRMIY